MISKAFRSSSGSHPRLLRGLLSTTPKLLAGAIVLAIVFPSPTPTRAQEQPKPPAATPKPALNVEPLVREWIKRLNALADWSADAKQGSADPAPAVNRMLELYDPGVLQFTGPNQNQIGPVIYSGLEGIRKWADNFAHEYSHAEFRIQEQTSNMVTAGLFHTAPLPWGGEAVAVELGAYYTMRENKRRFATPGAVFLEFTESGKVKWARLFLAKDETIEIFP